MNHFLNSQLGCKPNLFIVGAPKCGSTSLHFYIANHPEIFMSEPKELFYFIKELNWDNGLEWYLSHFQAAGSKKIIGESTVAYASYPRYKEVPKRMYEFNPEAKLIYIMRDPVKRSISHYWHNVRWHNEKRKIFDALEHDLDLINTSNYFMQINKFLSFYKFEQLYILTFEEMIADPALTVSKIFSWLNVNQNYQPCNLGQKMNVTPSDIYIPKGNSIIDKLRHTDFWERINIMFPKPIKKTIYNLTYRKAFCTEKELNKAIEYIRGIQKEQVKKLSGLLNRKFNEWKTLYAK